MNTTTSPRAGPPVTWYVPLWTNTRSPLRLGGEFSGLRAWRCRQFGQQVPITRRGWPSHGTTSLDELTGYSYPQSGQVTIFWWPYRVSAIDPVGMTNASTTNSLSISTRATTNAIVSHTSRKASRWCVAGLAVADRGAGLIWTTDIAARPRSESVVAVWVLRSRSQEHFTTGPTGGGRGSYRAGRPPG